LCLFLCLLLFLFCIKFAKNRKLLKEGSKIHFTDPFYNKNICW
jgi:hypothetical protein